MKYYNLNLLEIAVYAIKDKKIIKIKAQQKIKILTYQRQQYIKLIIKYI